MDIKKTNQSKAKLQYIDKSNLKDIKTIDLAITVTSNHNVDQYVLEKLFQDIQALRIQNYNLKPK